MNYNANISSQSIIERQLEEDEKRLQEEEQDLGFNPLVLYFGDDFSIANGKITIRQPVIQDYLTYGEDVITTAILPFVSNRTSMRLQLWNIGIDWNKIKEAELLLWLFKSSNPQCTKIIFGDVDFRKFELQTAVNNQNEEEVILCNAEQGIILLPKDQKLICHFIQHMFHRFPPEEEFTSSKQLKRDLINRDRQKIIADKMALKQYKGSNILSLISFCLNHPGFKYKKDELRNVGIYEFMDSVNRLNIYEYTRALHNGRFSGMCDLSKIDKNEFNFMRDISA